MTSLTNLTTDLSVARLGKPNGFAPLGSDAKVPSTALPTALAGGLALQGSYDASTNTPDLTTAPLNVAGILMVKL